MDYHPQVCQPMKTALTESAAGIAAKYHVERSWLDAHVADLMNRFANRPICFGCLPST